ncbi:hypothetical protein SAMN04488550_1526 [Gordonia malaquae]|uniref:DUF6036 domain-containing protein n=1 Tax=Gordonia malaquae NBRC 108250 TaxID=1223542 RepID=M3TGR5_GORML|nr:DUF6036 family nucleotidyltransferase [Gordonia malaquae]GAC80656.1 hypothetical protein GM1_020_00200 [Gordonia malaquae NBRC 108250]SEC24356.1 hypothetical protein SAMN04488550_1526 [Gordonia malaquae]
MNDIEIRLAIAAACKAADTLVVVVGSQAILGSYSSDELPDEATRSREADATPWTQFVGASSEEEIAESISRINVGVGEFSPFHARHGFYVEGVHGSTVILAEDWDNRLVRFEATIDGGAYECVGWCLHPEDICVSKIIAGREHDREYVKALIDAGFVDVGTVRKRVLGPLSWGAHKPDSTAVTRAVRFLDWLAERGPDGT